MNNLVQKDIIDLYLKRKIYNTPVSLIEMMKRDIVVQIRKFRDITKYTVLEDKKSIGWNIIYSSTHVDKLAVSYKTNFKICKQIPVFYIHHYFTIKNQDPDALIKELCGGGNVYTNTQYFFEKSIIEFLEKYMYTQLYYSDLHEKIYDFRLNTYSKVSVGDILFNSYPI